MPSTRTRPNTAAAARLVPGPLQAARELVTLRDCLRYACTRFEAAGIAYGQGTDNAWDEAAWLVLWALHLPPDQLEPFLEARLTLRERRVVLELVDRRCRERIPTAYLTGEAWLRGLRFQADARALVPRSLIAEALQETLPAWLADRMPETILDLCTGGGSLAVFAAHCFPQARVDATDLSEEALALARANVELHRMSERIALFQGDLFEGLATRSPGAEPGPATPYDLILCNPPYVSAARMAALPAEFRAEPELALAGGQDGMDFVRELLQQAASVLQPNGVLVLEIGNEIEHFQHAFPQLSVVGMETSAGDEQVLLITREALLAAFGPTQVAP